MGRQNPVKFVLVIWNKESSTSLSLVVGKRNPTQVCLGYEEVKEQGIQYKSPWDKGDKESSVNLP